MTSVATAAKMGRHLRAVNPRQTRRFAEAIGHHAKTNAVDAAMRPLRGAARAAGIDPS